MFFKAPGYLDASDTRIEMKSPIVECSLLLLAVLLQHAFAGADDWLDGKFELSQIERTAANHPGLPAFDDKFKSKPPANSEVISEIIKSAVQRPANQTATNRIDDFELNNSSPNTTASNAANSTLSPMQPRLYSLTLDSDRLLTLFWTVNHEQRHVLFELKLALPNQVSAPFLAFGFSAYGEFENADLCVLWNDEKGKFHFQDTWTDANGFINLDKQNDCELLSTKKVGNQIFLLFKRKLNTCDPHDFRLTKGTNHLLYALGNGQLEAVYGLRLASIKRKGFARVSLFKSKQIPPLLNPGRHLTNQPSN